MNRLLALGLIVLVVSAGAVSAEELTRDVRILRDTWGVPHIFGKTDADAAFGLAYAHCEDDFATFQESILTARGRMGEITGQRGAVTDYLIHLLDVWEITEARYELDLSAEMRAVLEGYAEGVNFYAERHRDDWLIDDFLPITGHDIAAGFVFRAPFFYGLERSVGELFGNERAREVSTKQAAAPDPFSPATAIATAHDYLSNGADMGSNAWAIGPGRTADGSTFLNANPHLAWEGPTTWYEVHVHSEEGWDMVGGLFPGTPVITVGHNRNLGWSHTVNRPDLVDIYVLEINPENPDQYKFDGEWLDLEIEEVTLRVKVTEKMSMPIRREVVHSVHGPVMRTDHGVYAIRYAGRGDIRAVEQWYRMNKARNFEEWMDAMRIRGIHSFNTIYGDKEGTVYAVYNALLPIRAEGYDWSKYLPGNTSETLWTEYLPFDKLPQVKNPASAFVQNCNASPFRMTFGPGNPREEDFSKTFGIETSMTNRALRTLELHEADDSITLEEFRANKWDMTYSKESRTADLVKIVLGLPPTEDAVLQEAIDVIANWDLRANPENRGMALAVLGLRPRGSRLPTPEELSLQLRAAAETLKRVHGRIDVPWQEVNRLRRGSLDLGLGGGPDVLHCINGRLTEDGGHLVGRQGDGLTMLIAWDKDGNVSSRSVHQYGTATTVESSPHYSDQAHLMAARKTKEVWMDEADIRAHLEREYRPGEE